MILLRSSSMNFVRFGKRNRSCYSNEWRNNTSGTWNVCIYSWWKLLNLIYFFLDSTRGPYCESQFTTGSQRSYTSNRPASFRNFDKGRGKQRNAYTSSRSGRVEKAVSGRGKETRAKKRGNLHAAAKSFVHSSPPSY